MRMFAAHLSLALCLACVPIMSAQAGTPGILSSADVEKVMPGQVFFHAQTASVQLRNSAAVRYADGTVTEAGMVDTSGYSSAQRDTYQFYLLTDVALTAGGKRIAPGAYGCGFVPDKGFVVMDVGGNELVRTAVTRDSNLARPRPLQMMPGSDASTVKLYLGRDFVVLQRSK
jgi:hypothetical protein